MLATRSVFRRCVELFVSWLAFGRKREVNPETILQHCIAMHGEVGGVRLANRIAAQRGGEPNDPI